MFSHPAVYLWLSPSVWTQILPSCCLQKLKKETSSFTPHLLIFIVFLFHPSGPLLSHGTVRLLFGTPGSSICDYLLGFGTDVHMCVPVILSFHTCELCYSLFTRQDLALGMQSRVKECCHSYNDVPTTYLVCEAEPSRFGLMTDLKV